MMVYKGEFSVKYHLSESFTHFTYFEAISVDENQEKLGVVYIPPGNNQNKN